MFVVLCHGPLGQKNRRIKTVEGNERKKRTLSIYMHLVLKFILWLFGFVVHIPISWDKWKMVAKKDDYDHDSNKSRIFFHLIRNIQRKSNSSSSSGRSEKATRNSRWRKCKQWNGKASWQQKKKIRAKHWVNAFMTLHFHFFLFFFFSFVFFSLDVTLFLLCLLYTQLCIVRLFFAPIPFPCTLSLFFSSFYDDKMIEKLVKRTKNGNSSSI